MTTPTQLQFDGRYSVIGLEETNQTSGTITYGELGSYYEVTTPHGENEDFETVAFVCHEDLARLFTAAPQLLAALQSILEYASDWETGCDDPRDIRDAEDAHASAIETARLAISKATN